MARRRTTPRTAVVDTNVILVANEQQPEVGRDCVLACIDALLDLRKAGKVALDDGDRIYSEFFNKTEPWSSQKTGDAFVKWVHDNRYNPVRCDRVSLTPMPDDYGDVVTAPDSEEDVSGSVDGGGCSVGLQGTETGSYGLTLLLLASLVLLMRLTHCRWISASLERPNF